MSFINKLTGVARATNQAAKNFAAEAKGYSKLIELKNKKDTLLKGLGEVVYNGELDRIDSFVEEIQVLTEEIELLDYQLLDKKMPSVEVKNESSEEVSEEEIFDKEEEVTLPEEEKE